MNAQKGHFPVNKKEKYNRLVVVIAFFLMGALLTTGCISSYRSVRDISQLPPDRSATIRVVITTTSQGKILQEEIEKDYWKLPGGRYLPYPVYNYEWYLWFAMDQEVYLLIPKGRTFMNNVSLIHEGDVANLTREYPVPTGKHMFWLEFAALRPYMTSGGSSSGVSLSGGGDTNEGGDYSQERRLGLIWKNCFSADLQPGQVVTVQIDDTGVHLAKEVKVEPMTNCNEWLLSDPIPAAKRVLP